jgi:hypothetical protein
MSLGNTVLQLFWCNYSRCVYYYYYYHYHHHYHHHRCLHFSGMLRSVDWKLVTDVYGQPVGPSSSAKQSKMIEYRSIHEVGPIGLCRNVGD